MIKIFFKYKKIIKDRVLKNMKKNNNQVLKKQNNIFKMSKSLTL